MKKALFGVLKTVSHAKFLFAKSMLATRSSDRRILKERICRELISASNLQYRGRIPHREKARTAKNRPLPTDGFFIIRLLSFVLAYRAMYASHAGIGGAAVNAFHTTVSMNMFPGRSLKTAVTIGTGTAVDAVPVVMIVRMEPVCASWTAGAIVCGTAKSAFCCCRFSSHKSPS